MLKVKKNQLYTIAEIEEITGVDYITIYSRIMTEKIPYEIKRGVMHFWGYQIPQIVEWRKRGRPRKKE